MSTKINLSDDDIKELTHLCRVAYNTFKDDLKAMGNNDSSVESLKADWNRYLAYAQKWEERLENL